MTGTLQKTKRVSGLLSVNTDQHPAALCSEAKAQSPSVVSQLGCNFCLHIRHHFLLEGEGPMAVGRPKKELVLSAEEQAQ